MPHCWSTVEFSLNLHECWNVFLTHSARKSASNRPHPNSLRSTALKTAILCPAAEGTMQRGIRLLPPYNSLSESIASQLFRPSKGVRSHAGEGGNQWFRSHWASRVSGVGRARVARQRIGRRRGQ